MKASIQNLRDAISKDRTPDLEDALLLEFEMVLDWIQGHDGSLRSLPLTSLLAARRPADYFSNHIRFDIFIANTKRCLSRRL